MSDARTDFFSSSDKETSKVASRDDFFAGKIPEKKNIYTGYQSPFAYSMSGGGIGGWDAKPDVSAVEELAPGFNMGVAQLMGLPMTTLVGAGNLASSGMGYIQSKITGEAPSPIFDPADPASVPFTGDWFAQKLDQATTALGAGPVTQMADPSSAAHRIVYNTAAGVPSGLIGGGGQAIPAVAGSAASAIGGELGLDPAAQASLALLASHGASKLGELPPGQAPEKLPAEKTAQEKLNAAASKQSMGAAGAAVDLEKLSPQLRDAVKQAVQKTGGAVNPEVLARQIQADSLPVKVPLSEGQSLGDARLISEERNARAKNPGATEAFEAQNKALTENLKVFRDAAGEDVFTTNPVEHADTLIGRYKQIDDVRNADISSKYKALQDAAGGEFPVDTQAMNSNVRAALKKQLATNNAPPDIMSALDEYAGSGRISLEDFETLRSRLASIQRTDSRGEVRHAAGVIRSQVEKLPLAENAANLKGIADTARAAARERFKALDADPAYKAAVEDTVSPDAFVNKFVTGKGAFATREQAAKPSAAMADDPTAAQTLKVAVLDHLRSAAGLDPSYNGNFTQSGYNKALTALGPRIGSLLDPTLVEHTQNLGDVARYSQFQPSGSFVNNSNTFVAAAGEKAKFAAEKAINMAVPGLDLGTMARERVESASAARQVKKSWAPGAGLTRLSDLAKIKEPR